MSTNRTKPDPTAIPASFRETPMDVWRDMTIEMACKIYLQSVGSKGGKQLRGETAYFLGAVAGEFNRIGKENKELKEAVKHLESLVDCQGSIIDKLHKEVTGEGIIDAAKRYGYKGPN